MNLAEYVPIYNGCRYCLMCRHVCPVGRATKNEATTPHGWALLIASVDRGLMTWNAEAVDSLYQCAQCGLCHANCVTDRPLPLAIAAARAEVVNAGIAPVAVRELDQRLRAWGNPYREIEPVPAAGSAPAGLFVGAAAQYLRPQTLEAAQRLLKALGVDYVPLGVGLASAYLPYALGLRDTACRLAQAALQDIQAAGCSRLIVLTPGDALAFSETHADLGLPLPDGLEVVELVPLLADAVHAGRWRPRAVPASLTYHDPALTPRRPGRSDAARTVVRALSTQPLREMLWREGRAAPGGAVGGLEFTNPALAAQMTRERLAEAAATGAQVLVTEDPAALASFTAQAEDSRLAIEGLYELLADAIA
jgi:Fe-S oxidoreductase